METFSTLGLPTTGRIAAWNDLYSSRMSRVEFIPADRHRFGAELRIRQLGPVKLAKLSVDRCSIERGRRHLALSPRLYSFLLQVHGSSIFYHFGHEARLSEGDFVLCDTGMPHYFLTRDASQIIMARVLPEVLQQYLPHAERYCGLRLGKAVSFTNMVGAMVRSLPENEESGPRDNYEERIARHLLEMISMSYTSGFEPVSRESKTLHQRRHEIIRYIEDHLQDSSLTPSSVAQGLGLSTRYLRTVLSASGERVSTYILQRRLDECARQIRDPAWRGYALMEIAFRWGFKSAAHFTRCFSDRFGMGPRAYRRAGTDRS